MAAGEDDETLRIHAELEDDVSVPAETAAEGVEELGEEAKRTERKLKSLERQASKTGNSLALLAVKRKAAGMTFADEAERVAFLNDEYVKLTRVQDKNTRTTKKQTEAVKKLGQETKKTKKEGNGFLGFLKKLSKLSLMSVMGVSKLGVAFGVVGLIAKAGTMIPGLIGIVAALTSLLSLVSLLPTAIGSFIAILSTMKLAVKGVGDAIGAGFAGDAEKFNEALKKLSPAAQKFVKDVVKFAPQLKKLQQGIQETFFRQLTGIVIPTLTRTIPVLAKATEPLVTNMGKLARIFLEFIGSAKGASLITTLFQAANRLVIALRNSLQPLMHGFTSMIEATGVHWERLMEAFEGGLTKFGGWLTRISEDGTLQGWLDLAFETAKQLLDVFRSIGRIFGALNVAGDGGALGRLSEILDRVATWMESAEGQDAIISFFDSLAKVSDALFPVLVMIASAIANVLAPSIADIVVGLLPGVITFLTALGEGLKLLMPVWKPLAEAVSSLLVALAPLLPVLGQLLTVIVLALVGPLKALAAVLTPLINAAMVPFLAVLTALAEMLIAQAPYMQRIIEAFASGFEKLAPILATVAQLFADRFAQFLPKLIEHWDRLVPLIEKLATAFGEYFVNALITLLPLLPGLIDAFFDLVETLIDPRTMSALFALLDVFIMLAPVFVELAPYLMFFIVMLLQIITIGLRLSAVVVGVFAGILSTVVNTVKGITYIALKILDALTKPFRDAFDAIVKILGDIVAKVGEQFDKIKEKIKGGLNFLKSFNPIDLFRAGGGPVAAGQSYVVGEIGPEKFVGDGGIEKTIGGNGPEVFTPPTSGMVVPNHLMKFLDAAEGYMQTALDASEASANAGLGGPPPKEEHTTNNYYSPTFNMPINNPQSDLDIKGAVKKAWKEIKQDETERSK